MICLLFLFKLVVILFNNNIFGKNKMLWISVICCCLLLESLVIGWCRVCLDSLILFNVVIICCVFMICLWIWYGKVKLFVIVLLNSVGCWK